jgi:hypothetical protein
MMPPRLDASDATAAYAALLRRIPGYVPGWRPRDGSPEAALLRIVARYREVLNERLNAAPEKNMLAFLDLLGISLVEAQSARAPIVFAFAPPAPPQLPVSTTLSSPGLAALNVPPPAAPMAVPTLNVRVPAATQVSAKGPDGSPIIFETEQAIGLTGARLAQVVSLWPGQDTYTDHTADLAAGRPTTLFHSTQVTPHMIYIAHDMYFALAGQARVELAFDLITPGSQAAPIAWEYWDGQGWHPFGDPDLQSPTVALTAADRVSGDSLLTLAIVAAPEAPVDDGTNGLTRSGVVGLGGDCVDTQQTVVNGLKSYWLRGRLVAALPPDLARTDALIKTIKVNTVIERLFDPAGLDANPATLAPDAGIKPDTAIANSSSVDLSKAFSPFGPAPQPGSVLYLSSEEVFSKPSADVRLRLTLVNKPAEDQASGTVDLASTPGTINSHPSVAWEYWNGSDWRDLGIATNTTGADFLQSGVLSFSIPEQGIPQSKLNGKDGRWVRARLAEDGYYNQQSLTIPSTSVSVNIVTNLPPMIADIRIAYVYRSPRAFPDRCLTYNDFQYVDHTYDVRWPGAGFAAFAPVGDATPSLYFGFDGTLPVDLVSLYAAIEEQEGQLPGPPLTWEYWNGLGWQETAIEDDTAQLVRPGMLAVIGPADAARLARFDTTYSWLRGRLREDGDPIQSVVDGLYLNAVWARQDQTIRNEQLGSGSGDPSQTFFFSHTPVLDNEQIEIRELDGPRAAIELPILAREVDAALLNVVYSTAGVIQEVWVRWQRQDNLFLSGPNDRHYIIERSGGRVLFGDGLNGRVVPAGTDNVVARAYQTGGGTVGNVPANAITQLLGGIPYVNGVSNPRAAEGGADGETIAAVELRGPQTLRNRERALSARDYEGLARAASPGVAVARALPATHPSGRPAPGWVKLIIIPNSQDPQPVPSFELRREVADYVQQRAPASLTGLFVTGPSYLPVGVAAIVTPLDLSQAGPVGVAVRQALQAFFQPLTGGPGGAGWPFGRSVYLSDVATMLENVPGVDFVQEIELLLDGITQGDVVPVPSDRIVVAGPMRVRLRARE